jgi:hypothetical protein
MDAITEALSEDYGTELAADVAFHMADWNGDAGMLVAFHLFPERFTPQEISAGIMLFLTHAPNHIREACRLTQTCVWESFPNDNDQSAESL